MAKTLVIALGNESYIRANARINFTVTAANTDAAAVTLKALSIDEASELGAVIDQPTFLTAGQPWDASMPTLAAGASASYGFSVMVPSPNMPGVSATNPGGAVPGQNAWPAANNQLVLRATGQTSDGSTFFTTLSVPVLSAVYPFPISDVGTTLFRQGGNANLIAVLF